MWASVLAQSLAAAQAEKRGTVEVVIDTELGVIEVEIETAKAPETSRNFLRYVDAGHYDGGQFHRTVTMDNQPSSPVKIEVVQASVSRDEEASGFGPIALERTTQSGLSHRDGTLSMARDEADTATSSFFICIGDQPELDFGGKRNPDGQGFAAFGRVTRGMEVVRRIQQAPHEEQRLTPPIRIRSVRRLRGK
jgi:peptidyl-prolyl cis-trans isomerase A (cyclophilin A)